MIAFVSRPRVKSAKMAPRRHRAFRALTVGVIAFALLASPAWASAKTSGAPAGGESLSAAAAGASLRPARIDDEFKVVGRDQFKAVIEGLLALPNSKAGFANEGLRGRAFWAFAACEGSKFAGEFFAPIKGVGLTKLAKALKAAAQGKRIAGYFTFAKLLTMKKLQSTAESWVLDKIGVHHCAELMMWVNYLINAARSVQLNGYTHMELHVLGTDYFTGLTVKTCEVQPRWGPDIDNPNRLNNGSTYYLDNWEGPDAGIFSACPTPDDYNIPLAKYAKLWQPSGF